MTIVLQEGLNALVVPGTLLDSLVRLALLIEQETELEPLEIMADIGGARLWRIDRKVNYGEFNALATGSIHVSLIRENWSA